MKNFKAKLFGVSLFVLTLAACNHKFDKVVPPSPNPPGVVYKAPKVLYIIADGARGTSVRDANIPTLTSLLPNSIYSWTSLADTGTNDATNWADMITGVTKAKHNVLSEDFAGNKLDAYPTIFTRMKSIPAGANLKVAAFTTSPLFKQYLTGGADVSESLAGDDALTSRMTDYLKTDTTSSIILGEFSGIEAAGKAAGSGFDLSFPAYKAAIGNFDTEVGTLLSTIKARASYSRENWMIIVTSNRGGAFTIKPEDDDRTIFSDPTLNTFTIFYNDSYKQTFIAKPFVGNSYTGDAVRFIGDPQEGIGQVSKELSPFYNFGDTSGITISMKVKKHKNPVNVSRGDYYYQWPGFVGKRGNRGPDNTPETGWGNNGGSPGAGWDFCLYQNSWRLFIAGKASGKFNNGEQIKGPDFSGDTWHDLTAVIERKPDGHAYVRLYTDGVEGIADKNGGSPQVPSTVPYDLIGTNGSLSTDVNLDNNSVMRVGYTPGEMDGGNNGNTFGKIDVEVKELKLFKTAMTDADVKQYACDQTIDRSNPYYAYLIGYWPFDEGSGDVAHDKGPYSGDFKLSQNQPGGYTWTHFTDLICSPPASNLSILVPKNADIPAQILSFFNISRQASWALDGKVWITN